MKLHLYLALAISLLLPMGAFSQLTGTVSDSQTKMPLAFANVKTDKGYVVSTDINGQFALNESQKILWISCSYIGYKTKKMTLQPGQKTISVLMVPDESQLSEVVVTNINPANAIIRKVIASKPKNNPENLKSFEYNCYNKMMLNVRTSDTTHIKISKDKHAFMMESVTHRKFLAPDLSEEIVTASRVSGFRDPRFATVMTDFQPFTFYKEDIPMLDKHYLNPISDNSLNKYKFQLEETRVSGRDTVYVISFRPKPDKNFDALKGQLYINSNGYAVQNVVAAPAERKKVELHIVQQYQFTNGQWFPEQMSFALVFNEYPAKNMSMAMEGKSYIDSVHINPTLRRRDFGIETVQLLPDATQKDSVYWNSFRKEQLNAIDRKTYRLLDSVGVAHNTDKLLEGFVSFFNGRLPIGPVDIDINRTFMFNKYEGTRLGTGLYTNNKVFKNITLGGFYGYGFKDEESKYGGEIVYEASRKHELTFGAKYYKDLFETGLHNTDASRGALFDYRRFIGSQYDMKEGFSVSAGFRSLRWLKWQFALATESVAPKYDYYFDNKGTPITDYHHTNLNINLRFAYKERLATVFNKRTSSGTNYPVLQLSYTRGFKNWLDGDFAYHKMEAQLKQSFYTKTFGTTSYALQAGYLDRPLPYGLNFTGEGSYDKKIPVLMKNVFQTMYPYEFLSDRYVNLFLTHDFAGLLFKAGRFQPGISLHTNLGWGDLSRPESHQLIAYKIKDKIFAESGLQFDSLLKLDYFGIADAGFGVAAYYRYGAYTLPDFDDNLVFKLTFKMTLK
ncbi:DUF5686 family protein [Flavobacterium pallidum]|uniref:Carboxypeptidase-like regulatory domain-containing protein n=1 Tax=Flavobacterium pallidum TaxID=2172098 RepID=A0A2S1SFV2_9FLAO|nr:DUF5686 family protein [Flavobacterium pallidum]AWI25217.1 hypothetical protein HYN49_04525 [Flavobacterium pallidum]